MILYLVTEDWYFWSHRLQLAEAAKAQGHEIIVVTQAGDFAKKITAKGFMLIPLVIHRSVGSPLSELRTIVSLVKLYKAVRPDVIHHIALKPVISGSIAAWIAGMPRVVNAYTGLGYLFVSRSLTSRFFKKVVTPFISLVLRDKKFHSIVQNRDDEQQLLGLGLVKPGRTSLVPGSGVDAMKFDVSPEPAAGAPVVLFASRLLKDKGIIEYIQASRILKAGGNAARFVVVGNMDTANPTSINDNELRDWIDQDIIEWWGYRADMDEVFQQAHVVCLPSYREGLPKVLLEAAASGRPVVTTDVPGCRDVVVDGVTGYLVPARDPVKLADAIRFLLASPALRRRMGDAGRKRVMDHFDIDRINSATIAIYSELLTRP